jgi:hypothetical protein
MIPKPTAVFAESKLKSIKDLSSAFRAAHNAAKIHARSKAGTHFPGCERSKFYSQQNEGGNLQ